MMTVHQVSRLTGVTVRTLQYYDKIGLLPPAEYTDAGYRLYDDAALERLQQILLFRELEFPLKDIREILNSPNFNRQLALGQQIELLTMKRDHLTNLIRLARGIKLTGGGNMDFTAFDTKKIDEYAQRAREQWGATPAYREFEEKNANRTPSEIKAAGERLMALIAAFGSWRGTDPAAPQVQDQVKALQDFITEHYYHCTDEILSGLGEMYAGGGEFTANIDAAGGEGTAEFVRRAIEVFCGK